MNSQRETELKPCPFCGTTDLYLYPDGDMEGHSVMGDHKDGCMFSMTGMLGHDTEQNAIDSWNTRQAATEQGEPVGEVQTYQSTGSHKSVTGILWYDGEPESGSKLYTHPPKPTGGGVPEGYVLVPLDVVDREEILDKAMDYHFDWCGYASRSDLSEAARAVAYAARDLATQQPPEQD